MNLTDKREVEKLVKACIKGDRMSQQTFFKVFYGKMLVVCMRYMRDRDEAKDVLQDAFIKVFANLERFEFTGSLEAWVRRIVVNTAIDQIRKKNIMPFELNENIHSSEPEDDTDELFEMQQAVKFKADVVLQLIQKLSPMYKAVFNLYVFESYTHKEIAEILNINIGTSKSNFAKAKKNLRKLFDNYSKCHGQ